MPVDSDERSALLHFLAANRAAAVAVVDGLTESDAHQVAAASGWSIFDLVVHLGEVERHWFSFALNGDALHSHASPGPVTTLEEALVAYRAECDRSDRILSTLELDHPLVMQPAELVGEVTTVRGVVLHVIEEVARHAGHLDLARETVDGRTGLGPR